MSSRKGKFTLDDQNFVSFQTFRFEIGIFALLLHYAMSLTSAIPVNFHDFFRLGFWNDYSYHNSLDILCIVHLNIHFTLTDFSNDFSLIYSYVLFSDWDDSIA